MRDKTDSLSDEQLRDLVADARAAHLMRNYPLVARLADAVEQLAALRAREAQAVQKCNLCGDTAIAPAGAGEVEGAQPEPIAAASAVLGDGIKLQCYHCGDWYEGGTYHDCKGGKCTCHATAMDLCPMHGPEIQEVRHAVASAMEEAKADVDSFVEARRAEIRAGRRASAPTSAEPAGGGAGVEDRIRALKPDDPRWSSYEPLDIYLAGFEDAKHAAAAIAGGNAAQQPGVRQ